jgi:voltage-gated potassium channel Kch
VDESRPLLLPAVSSSSSSSTPSSRGRRGGIWSCARSLDRFRSLPWLPPSPIPGSRFPVSRVRHRLYLALSDPWTSRVGQLVFAVNSLGILAYVIAFSISSQEDYRIREAEGFYGPAEEAFDVVDAVVTSTFAASYLARALCVTAVPDAVEARLFRAAVALNGGPGGAARGRPSRGSSWTAGWDEVAAAAGTGAGGGGGGGTSDGGFVATADKGKAAEEDEDEEDEDDNIDEEDAIGILDLDGTTSLRKGTGGRVYSPLVDARGFPLVYSEGWRGLLCCGCSSSSSSSSSHGRGLGGGEDSVWRRASGRLFFWGLNVYNVIDFLTILPYIVDIASEDISNDRRAAPLRVLRFLCLLRLLRLLSDTITLRLLRRAVLLSLDALWGSLYLTIIFVVFFSAGIFLVEHGDFDPATRTFLRPTVSGNGTEPSPFRSIFHALYWTVVTMTTCGYGDLVPTTPAGKVLAVLTIGSGLLLLALPATVVGTNLSAEYQRRAARIRAKEEAAAAEARERSRELRRLRGHEMSRSTDLVVGLLPASAAASSSSSSPPPARASGSSPAERSGAGQREWEPFAHASGAQLGRPAAARGDPIPDTIAHAVAAATDPLREEVNALRRAVEALLRRDGDSGGQVHV